MENELEEILEKILSDNAISSEKALSLYLRNNEDVVIKIKEAAASSQWMHFSERSQDGWYCIQRSSKPSKFDVFYKERGAVAWGFNSFENKSEAIASVIVQAGYATFKIPLQSDAKTVTSKQNSLSPMINSEIILWIPGFLGILLLVVSFIDLQLFHAGNTVVKAMLAREIPIFLLGLISSLMVLVAMIAFFVKRNWKSCLIACASFLLFLGCFMAGGILGAAYLNAT